LNKVLSQLEAVYGVKKSVIESASPSHISEFIIDVCERPEFYQLEGITKEELELTLIESTDQSVNIIKNLLLERGHNVDVDLVKDGLLIYMESLLGE